MRRFTYKRFARAALIRGIGREISAANRKARSKNKRGSMKTDSQVFNGVVDKKAAFQEDLYKNKRQEIHGHTLTILTRKDGGVDCPVCGSDMGQPREKGLFQKHFEYNCPTCHITAVIGN